MRAARVLLILVSAGRTPRHLAYLACAGCSASESSYAVAAISCPPTERIPVREPRT